MSNQIQKQIWEELARRRDISPMDLKTLKNVVESTNLEVNYEDIYQLLSNLSSQEFGEFYTPELFLEVTQGLTKSIAPKKILIPSEKDGSVSNLTTKESWQSAQVASYILNPEIFQLVRPYLPSSINIINEKFPLKKQFKDTFDLVIADLPWGLKKERFTYSVDGQEHEILDSQTNHILCRSALQLSDKGMAIYTTTNDFFIYSKERGIHSILNELGLYIDAVIQMPSGTYKNTSIPANIVVISKRMPDKIFVAGVTSKNIKQVLSNYQSREEVDVPELGSLVSQGNLKSPEIIFEQRRVMEFAKRIKAEIYPNNEVFSDVLLPDRKVQDGGFNDTDDAIYIPKVGTSDVVSSKEEFRIKPQNYLQLILNEKKAINIDFLLEFLNSEEGRRLRSTWARGSVIQNVSKKSILDGQIFLPHKAQQDRIIKLHRDISEYESLIGESKTKLWNNISRLDDVEKLVFKLNKLDAFESWLEDLPFPLASIVWRYRSQKEIRDKVDSLLHFFETSAQFFSTIFLSASMNDRKWLKELVDEKMDFYRSNFGLWTVLCDRGMKKARRSFSSNKEGEKEELFEYLKTKNKSYVNAISNKQLQKLLNSAREIRNGIAHGGNISSGEYNNYLQKLKELLRLYREVIGIVFSSVILITPISSKYKDGINVNKVYLLNGARTPFKQIQIKTIEQLEDASLYLYDVNSQAILKLLSLLRLDSSPDSETNAIYFYNKIESDGELYVSYHLDSVTKKKYKNTDLVETFKIISNMISGKFDL